jgi:L-threonylcarbamoyladenylate synthase
MNTQVTSIHHAAALDLALRLLNQHEVIAAPTDTVYGVMARYDSLVAIEKLYAAKQRPPQKPIPVLISQLHQLASLTTLPVAPVASFLMERFWPGALTLVLPALPTLPPILTAGEPTIGVRMPAYEPLRTLLDRTGPLAATSANLSGAPDATSAADVLTQLDGHVPLVLEDEAIECSAIPSTVIDLSRPQEFPRMLRRGELAGAINGLLYSVFGYAC